MQILATAALSLATTAAAAHPGHGQPGWFHRHADDLIEVALIAIACLVAVAVVKLLWKAFAR